MSIILKELLYRWMSKKLGIVVLIAGFVYSADVPCDLTPAMITVLVGTKLVGLSILGVVYLMAQGKIDSGKTT